MNEQQQTNQGMAYSFYEKQDTEDYNKFMQSMERPIEQLIYKLRGKEIIYDREKQQYIERSRTKSMVNEEGINYIEGMLTSTLNPNLYMAKLENGQAQRYIIGTKKQLGMIINMNRVNWEIKIDNIRPVITLLCGVVSYAITKAKSDKDFLKDTMSAKYANMSRDKQAGAPQADNFGF